MNLDQVLHQLNTSLVLLKWNIESLPDNCQEQKKTLETEIKHAQKLMEECKESQKIDNNEPVNILEISETAFHNFAAKKTHHKMEIKPFRPASGLVETHPFYAYEILRTVLENAIKHTPENQNINLSYETKPQQLIIHIENHGVGLSPEKLKKSTGLGLSIIDCLAKKSNCQVGYHSDGKSVTTFSITYNQIEA